MLDLFFYWHSACYYSLKIRRFQLFWTSHTAFWTAWFSITSCWVITTISSITGTMKTIYVLQQDPYYLTLPSTNRIKSYFRRQLNMHIYTHSWSASLDESIEPCPSVCISFKAIGLKLFQLFLLQVVYKSEPAGSDNYIL